jgi:hypothetical protein
VFKQPSSVGRRDLLACALVAPSSFLTVQNNSADLKKLNQRREGFMPRVYIAAARTDLRHEIVND